MDTAKCQKSDATNLMHRGAAQNVEQIRRLAFLLVGHVQVKVKAWAFL